MPFHTTAILRICAALFLRRLPERKAGLRDSSTPKYRSACRNFTGDRFMDPGRRSSSSDSRGVDCVSDPEQHRLSGHHRGPRRNPGDDRPWRVVVGCLALRQKAYRTSGALGAFELYLKRRNPNSVQLLAVSEDSGTVPRNCPAYVREWVARERTQSEANPSEQAIEGDDDTKDF
jgi:hypothetical protein